MNAKINLNHEDIFKQDKPLAELKQIIKSNDDLLKAEFAPDTNVNQLLIDNAIFIDNILILCWNHFLKQHGNQLSLIATGGYGRKELFPKSDIDILILLKTSSISAFEDDLSAFSNFLWDIGLKPGQSTRTVDECIEAASGDQTIMTNLLEVRLITGCPTLFKQLTAQVSHKKLWQSADFFAAKMLEQEKRYTKFHDTAYNLEPNIKEGPGGLRDLQNIAWVFKQYYKASSLKDLIKHDFLSETEYSELNDCRNILWRIRFALHLLTNRSEDRLLFNYQRELATQFGFIDKDNNPDVEQFMQHYFKTVMELERTNEILLQLFNEKVLSSSPKITKFFPDHEYFVSINGYVEAKQPDTFKKHPIALLDIFPLLQQNPSLKGVRATTIRLIRQSLHHIDDDFRNNPNANKIFRSILQSSYGITQQFRRMNRYGILAAYLPCFANIVARMQYDLFHIYTVDAHTLFVLRNLRRFSLDKHKDETPFCSSVFLRISKPENLYIAALFHDIAKGMGGDHSTLGEAIAEQFCTQHKITKQNTKLITWLVRNHLLMSMTAQRKDISDPDVIHEFALQVGSIDYLNHIYLLTVADIRATNPSLWNSWKDSLLSELYTHTHSALHRGLQNPIARSERLYENKQEAREELLCLGISETTIQKTWKQINDDYFIRYSADEIAWHTIALASRKEHELPYVILRPQNQRGSVEVFVYTKNENKIFSISAATLDFLGLTILDARIVTITLSSTEQYVLNSFQVLEKSGKPIIDLARELHICKTLRNNLNQDKNQDNSKELLNINRHSRQAKYFPIRTSVTLHIDPLNRYTIIELITTDRAGLLAEIGQAFIDLNVQLHDAKITTIGSRVEDMFYITDTLLHPIQEQHQLDTIKEKLISVASHQNKK